MFKLRPRGKLKILQVHYSYNGKRFRVSSKTMDKNKATEFALNYITRKGQMRDLHTITWLQAVDRYLTCIPHKSDKERAGDKAKLKWITQELGNPLLENLKKSELLAVIEKKLEAQRASTANRYIAVINSLFLMAFEDWQWIVQPIKLKYYPEPPTKFTFRTREEIGKLISVSPFWFGCLVRFAVETGLRKSNIENLEWKNVDMENAICWINADEAKGKRAIRIPLNTAAMQVLRTQQRYKDTRMGYVFDRDRIQKRLLDKLCEEAKIPRTRFHDFRHTCASWLVQDGVSLYQVKELLGHSSIKTTERYAHFAPNNHNKVYHKELPACGYATAC